MTVTPELTVVDGGWRVRTEGEWHIDVRPMLRMFRLVEVSVDDHRRVGRYWCFTSFEAAVLAALPWDASGGDEPVGWVRKGGARS